MAKRQQRISSPQIEGAFYLFKGVLSTLVFRSGRAMLVTPYSFVNNCLVVMDMLGKNHTFPLSAIEEVIVEKSA